MDGHADRDDGDGRRIILGFQPNQIPKALRLFQRHRRPEHRHVVVWWVKEGEGERERRKGETVNRERGEGEREKDIMIVREKDTTSENYKDYHPVRLKVFFPRY